MIKYQLTINAYIVQVFWDPIYKIHNPGNLYTYFPTMFILMQDFLLMQLMGKDNGENEVYLLCMNNNGIIKQGNVIYSNDLMIIIQYCCNVMCYDSSRTLCIKMIIVPMATLIIHA